MVKRVLVRPQVALMTRTRRPGVDLEAALSAVPSRVAEALKTAMTELDRLGIRHAICGDLAVGAHGWARATQDVDFLVGDEAFEHHGPMVTSRVPFQVGAVAVDAINFPDAPFLDEELTSQPGQVRIVSIGALAYMKLRANRRKDQVDLIELCKVGVDEEEIRAYLGRHAKELLAAFERLAQQAAEEGASE